MIIEQQSEKVDPFLEQIDLVHKFTEEYEFNLVLPGDVISDNEGLIQGSGTYQHNGVIYSSLVGYVAKTNKLVSVRPVKSRYKAKVGDIVIGRVSEIVNKRWMINIESYDVAQLHLNAVKLPEIQRRKTEEDERQMRQFLCEGDLVVAEVQQISNSDKSISIHIRNNKFGKLQNGFLTRVSSDLIKKQSRHMIDLSMGLKLILGMNGWIWLEPLDAEDKEAFEKIAKIVNILKLFEENYIGVRLDTVLKCYTMTQNVNSNDIAQGPIKDQLVDFLAKTVNEISKDNIANIIATKKQLVICKDKGMMNC